MSTYEKLDDLIVAAIKARSNPLYERNCQAEADRIATGTGRETSRVIDGRLQALRKRGLIHWMTKAQANGSGGWHVTGGTR